MGLFLPNIAYASIDSFVANVNKLIINPIIVFLFALAVAYFLYGVFQFIANQDSEEKKTAGKSHMMYGILGMVIMMGVFVIMNVLLRTFNIKGIKPEEGTVELNDYNPKWPKP
jgi:uncharacterized membrane protein YidH (DUF202 family)